MSNFTVTHVSQNDSLSIHIFGHNESGEFWRTTFATTTMDRSAFALWLTDTVNNKGEKVDLLSEYDGDTDNFWVNIHLWRLHSTDFYDWR